LAIIASFASEVMRAGLRLLENEAAEQAEKLTVLKRLANEVFDDLDQGRGTQLDGEESISAFVSELGKKARTGWLRTEIRTNTKPMK
jgi:antitoxin ParD1/3/4